MATPATFLCNFEEEKGDEEENRDISSSTI
jgi:hypothetical protein